MQTTMITEERECGRRGRRFRGHPTSAAVPVVGARKAATLQRLALTLVTSAILTGLTVTSAGAIQPSPEPPGLGVLQPGPEPGGGSTQGGVLGTPGVVLAPVSGPLCSRNFWSMDLKTGRQTGALPSGTVLEQDLSKSQAVVQLDLNPGAPARKCTQANIVVEYEGTPTGWTVNIGDSRTNNGFGGGSGPSGIACAEVQVRNSPFPAGPTSLLNAYEDCRTATPLSLSPSVSPLTLTDGALKFVVRDNYLSVGQPFANSAGTGKSFHIPDTAFPAPDGSKIYAAFNRVISGPGDRVGTGVRRIMITMQ